MDSGLGQLLDQLMAEGAVDSGGVFTVDLNQALAKMRRYQLEGRQTYLQALVTAAVLGQATRFQVDGRGHAITVSYDGLASSADDLRRLFSSLLTTGLASRQRELAVAVNTLLGEDFEGLLFQSFDGFRGGELRFSQGQLQVNELDHRPWSDPHFTNRFRVTRKARGLKGLLKTFQPLNEERDFLQERCSLAPLTLEVAGETLARSQPLPDDCLALGGLVSKDHPLTVDLPQAHFRRAGASPGKFTALVAVTLNPDPRADLTFVVSGVSFRHHIPIGYPGLVAVVATDSLPKNFSQTDLVAGSEKDQLLDLLGQEALKLVATVATDLDRVPEQERQLAREMILRCLPVAVKVDRPEASEGLGGFLEAPLFRLADGEPTALLPLVNQYRAHGFLPYTTQSLSRQRIDDLQVLLTDESELEALASVFPERRDYFERLLEAPPSPPRSASSQPSRTVLPPWTLTRLEGQVKEWDPASPSRVGVVSQGRVGLSWEEPGLPPGLMVEVECPGFKLDHPLEETTNQLLRDRIVAQVAADLPEFYTRLHLVEESEWERSDSLARQHLLNFLGWCGRYQGDDPPIGILTHVDTLRTVHGAMLSLADLFKDLEQRGYIGVVSHELSQAGLRGGDLPSPVTLAVFAHERKALARFLGPYSLHHYDDLLKYRRARPDFFNRTIAPAVLPGGMIWKRPFHLQDIQGEVGVPREADTEGLQIRLLLFGRLIQVLERDLGFGPVLAIVSCPRLRPNSRWDGVVADPIFEEVMAVVEQQARSLCQEMKAELEHQDRPGHLRAVRFVRAQMLSELRRFYQTPEEVASEPCFRAFCRLPVFFDLFGATRSLEELMPETRTAGIVGYTLTDLERDPSPEEIILRLRSEEVQALRAVLEMLDLALLDRAFLLQRPSLSQREAILPEGVYLARGQLDGLAGEVGLVGGREPSVVEVLAHYRSFETRRLEGPVSFRAVVNHDRAATSPRLVEAVVEQVQRKALALVEDLAEAGHHRLFLLEVLSRAGSSRLGQKLTRAPLLRDVVSWGLVSIGSLAEPIYYLPHDLVNPRRAEAARSVASGLGWSQLLVLDEAERELARELVAELKPLPREFLVKIQAIYRQGVKRRTSFRLEEMVTGGRWLARQPLEGSGVMGEIGLLADQRPGRCLISVDGIPMPERTLSEAGLMVIVDGPFEVTEDYSQLRDFGPVQRLIEVHRQGLLEWLSVHLPQTPELRSRALRVLGEESLLAKLSQRSLVTQPDYQEKQTVAHQDLETMFQALASALKQILPEHRLTLAPFGSGRELFHPRRDGLALNVDHPLLAEVARRGRFGLQLLVVAVASWMEPQSPRATHGDLVQFLLDQ